MNKMMQFFGGPSGMPPKTQNAPQNGFGNVMSMMSKFGEFMQNPMSYFANCGINVPPNIRENPEAITNYLRSTGQMTDDQYNQAAQMASMAQKFFGKKS